MFEEADNFADIFRGLPYYLLLALPILIICSSNPVLGSSEFSVQRMSHFDVNSVPYGCRVSGLSLEAKSVHSWSTGRHCVVAKLHDLTIEQFREIRQKAGGLVVLLPDNVAAMSAEEKEYLNLLEQAMLAQPSSIPVYFSQYNKELEQVIADITRTTSATRNVGSMQQTKQSSAVSELFASISANGYQVIVSGNSHNPNKNAKIAILQGEVTPSKFLKQMESGGETAGKLPLIVLTAHLNTFGLYNEYPLNADAAVLMTVADMFNKMHHTVNSAPKFRLMFLLSESGALLNFQGIKRWLDDNMQLQNVEFVLCLDTIVQPLNDEANAIYMHVSKPPKDGTAMNNFYRLLKSAGSQYDNVTVDGVHKKINLADQTLAWEHERFSMKRLPAFTLSALKTPKESVRTTIFKDDETQILTHTHRRAKIIAEALGRYIYNIEDGEIFAEAMQINKNLIKSYMNLKSTVHNNDLKNAFEKYLKNVKILYEKPDAREPEFMLYDGQDAKLNVYKVKPAVFDLFLTIIICLYLLTVYSVIHYFPNFYAAICKMTKTQATMNGNNNYTDRFKSNVN